MNRRVLFLLPLVAVALVHPRVASAFDPCFTNEQIDLVLEGGIPANKAVRVSAITGRGRIVVGLADGTEEFYE
jgi:hypothetical protein